MHKHAPKPGAPAPTPAKAAPAPSRARGLMIFEGLQGAAGNRAVSRVVENGRTVQRVPVTMDSREETLHNDRTTTPGVAAPRVYGDARGATLDMARTPGAGTGGEQLTVTVKIRFVVGTTQTAADGTVSRDNSATTGSQVIPPADPRRAWAIDICNRAPGVWNGHGRLVGNRAADEGIVATVTGTTDPGGPVRLPVVFRAIPVWDAASPADKTIRVFDRSTTAGGTLHPIDAGHYYMDKGKYPFTEDQIYAHEYGHLIGLADEYSQSNPQMHALLHDIDPATAASRGAAMDRAAVRRSVLAALTRPLFDRLSSAMTHVGAALRGSAGPVRAALGSQLRAALATAETRAWFETLAPPVAARLSGTLPGLVRAATRSWSNTAAVANSVVGAELATPALSAMARNRYNAALMGTQSGVVDLGGIGMNVNVEGNAGITATGNAVIPPTGIWNSAMAGASGASASAVADKVVGALQTGRTPPVRPSGSILRQLESLPSGWAGFAAAAPAGLGSAALSADINSAMLAAWVARITGSAATPAMLTNPRRVARAVNAAVHSAATAAATNAMRAFLASEINPILDNSATTLSASVTEEVDRVMNTPAGALAATAPKDPNIAALSSTLSAQLAAGNALTRASTAVNAVGAAVTGGPAVTEVNPRTGGPAQPVTFGTENIMSDNKFVFRVDQFADIAAKFNGSGLRRDREGDFRPEIVS